MPEATLLTRIRWRVRRRVWTLVWTVAVLPRLGNRKVPIPTDEKIRLIHAPDSYSDFQAPSLVVPANLPSAESSRVANLLVRIIHFLQDVYPVVRSGQPQADPDRRIRARQAFSALYRRAIDPPHWHADLVEAEASGNLLGVLATSGPFSKFLRRSEGAPSERYRIDLAHMAAYPVRKGLLRLGCAIEYAPDGEGEVRVERIVYDGRTVRPSDSEWTLTQDVALCSLLTHLTVWRHGMQYHVGGLGPIALLTHNLPPAHPIRRLLAAHIDQTAATNYHTHVTLRRGGFDVTGFSFSYATILGYYDDGVRGFDLSELDVRISRTRRGIPDSLGREYFDQTLRYWDLIAEYLTDYVGFYYADERSVAGDADLQSWFEEIDRWVPNGVRGYVPELNRSNLIRLCTLFIYSVVVEHEENTQWKYAPFLAPTVHEDGTPPTVGEVQSVMNFQFVISSAQNKLMQDFSYLARDAGGSTLMKGFQQNLKNLQAEMERQPDRFWKVLPAELEASVSA